MQALVPVLETERLVLRAPALEDFQRVADILLSPQGEMYGHPKAREEAWYGFLQLTATWYLRGTGAWMLTLRDTGEVIGLSQISPEPGDEEHELGWLLAAEHKGQGFATEAAAAIRDHAFGEMQLPGLVSYINAQNAKSVAVAKRLSAVEDTPETWSFADTDVYRHPRPSDARPKADTSPTEEKPR